MTEFVTPEPTAPFTGSGVVLLITVAVLEILSSVITDGCVGCDDCVVPDAVLAVVTVLFCCAKQKLGNKIQNISKTRIKHV